MNDPISFQIPDDIFLEIIHHVAHFHFSQAECSPSYNPYSWFNISLVCRHWRDTILCTSTLWTFVEWTRNPSWVLAVIQRSNEIPIRLCIDAERFIYDGVHIDTMRQVLSQLPRAKHLCLHGSLSPLLTEHMSQGLNAPVLKSISFDRCTIEGLDYLFNGDLPSLRRVSSVASPLQVLERVMRPTVSHTHIGGGKFSPAHLYDRFIHLLKNSPHLHSLDISNCSIYGTTVSPNLDRGSISLPKLEHFRFHPVAVTYRIAQLLDAIHFPDSTKVDFSICRSTGEPPDAPAHIQNHTQIADRLRGLGVFSAQSVRLFSLSVKSISTLKGWTATPSPLTPTPGQQYPEITSSNLSELFQESPQWSYSTNDQFLRFYLNVIPLSHVQALTLHTCHERMKEADIEVLSRMTDVEYLIYDGVPTSDFIFLLFPGLNTTNSTTTTNTSSPPKIFSPSKATFLTQPPESLFPKLVHVEFVNKVHDDELLRVESPRAGQSHDKWIGTLRMQLQLRRWQKRQWKLDHVPSVRKIVFRGFEFGGCGELGELRKSFPGVVEETSVMEVSV